MSTVVQYLHFIIVSDCNELLVCWQYLGIYNTSCSCSIRLNDYVYVLLLLLRRLWLDVSSVTSMICSKQKNCKWELRRFLVFRTMFCSWFLKFKIMSSVLEHSSCVKRSLVVDLWYEWNLSCSLVLLLFLI